MEEFPHIETLTGNIEIGKTYITRCVKFNDDYYPVQAESHEDKQLLGVSHHYHVQAESHEDKQLLGVSHHYHYDLRFLSDQQIDKIIDGKYCEEDIFILVLPLNEETKKVICRPFVCYRKMPIYPSRYHEITKLLEEGLPRNIRINNVKAKCLRCPHRKTPLNGLTVRNGIVTCPAHGLSWNLDTGQMVKKHICN